MIWEQLGFAKLLRGGTWAWTTSKLPVLSDSLFNASADGNATTEFKEANARIVASKKAALMMSKLLWTWIGTRVCHGIYSFLNQRNSINPGNVTVGVDTDDEVPNLQSRLGSKVGELDAITGKEGARYDTPPMQRRSASCSVILDTFILTYQNSPIWMLMPPFIDGVVPKFEAVAPRLQTMRKRGRNTSISN